MDQKPRAATTSTPAAAAVPSSEQHLGYLLAVASSVALLGGAATMMATALWVSADTGFQATVLWNLFASTPLPEVLYALWTFAVFGTAGAIVACFVFGFRARWFWRCLVVTACLWLTFPPLFTVIGLLALIILVHTHRAFPKGREPVTDLP